VTDPSRRRDDERAIQVALFRYGVVAPLVDQDEFASGEVVRIVRSIAEQPHYLPGSGPVRISERTVYDWAKALREGGIEALRPAVRKDAGTRRVLSDKVLQRAVQLRKEQRKRKTSTLLDIMRREGTLDGQLGFHRATLDRHLDRLGASRRRLKVLGSQRTIKMEFDNFGDLWVGDYHHGPLVITPDERVVAAKLGAFIDHCTRYPVADRYYLDEGLDSLRDCLLRALMRWGSPDKTYVDRAKIYRSDQLRYALRSLDCILVHSRAYYSKGRGVIERWWQHANDFEDEVRLRDELLTIHELNVLWEAWREQRYCHQIHSELGRTPAQAVAEVTGRPLDPEVAAKLFLVREGRTVHREDGCVRVHNRKFLCESFLRKRRVRVHYDPNDLRSVEIYFEGRRVQTAFPQPINAKPEPPPEIEDVGNSVDYLALLRDDYDKKLLEHARPLRYADLRIDERFDEERFHQVVADLAGLELRPAASRELSDFWRTFGPLPEDLVRIGCEHAVRMHGRGRHVRVYTHAVRTLVLAHFKTPAKEER